MKIFSWIIKVFFKKVFKLVSETGPAHKREFKVEVIIDDLVYGVGVGGSKKEAEQNAAKEAYMKRAK